MEEVKNNAWLIDERKEKNKRYLKMLFSIFTHKDRIFKVDEDTHFKSTEIRLIGEILAAKSDGKRLISSQLAGMLGITRSAVSQIVLKLEGEGVIRRIPSETDKKSAYVEISESALAEYGEDLEIYIDSVGELVQEFGEEKFETMYALVKEFFEMMQSHALQCE